MELSGCTTSFASTLDGVILCTGCCQRMTTRQFLHCHAPAPIGQALNWRYVDPCLACIDARQLSTNASTGVPSTPCLSCHCMTKQATTLNLTDGSSKQEITHQAVNQAYHNDGSSFHTLGNVAGDSTILPGSTDGVMAGNTMSGTEAIVNALDLSDDQALFTDNLLRDDPYMSGYIDGFFDDSCHCRHSGSGGRASLDPMVSGDTLAIIEPQLRSPLAEPTVTCHYSQAGGGGHAIHDTMVHGYTFTNIEDPMLPAVPSSSPDLVPTFVHAEEDFPSLMERIGLADGLSSDFETGWVPPLQMSPDTLSPPALDERPQPIPTVDTASFFGDCMSDPMDGESPHY